MKIAFVVYGAWFLMHSSGFGPLQGAFRRSSNGYRGRFRAGAGVRLGSAGEKVCRLEWVCCTTYDVQMRVGSAMRWGKGVDGICFV
jgi:hypothetical protein